MSTHLRNLIATAAAFALFLVPLAASSVPVSPERTVAVSVTSPAATVASGPGELRGTGGWQKLACLGCVAGFLFVSGTGSVAAVIAVIAAYPEVAALCAAGCYAAYAI